MQEAERGLADAHRALKFFGPVGVPERTSKVADKTAEDNPTAGGKVLPFRRRMRAQPRPRRRGPRGVKPPTELTSSVRLILSRLGLCGAD
jgi:hypothetical protein